MSDYQQLRSKLFAKVNGWLEQSSNVCKDDREVEEQNMTPRKPKENRIINQRKSLEMAEVSRKIRKPPARADKILNLSKNINKVLTSKVTDKTAAKTSTGPDVINVPNRTNEDFSTGHITLMDITDIPTASNINNEKVTTEKVCDKTSTYIPTISNVM